MRGPKKVFDYSFKANYNPCRGVAWEARFFRLYCFHENPTELQKPRAKNEKGEDQPKLFEQFF